MWEGTSRLGNGEIYVLAGGIIYTAPTLVIHYIDAPGYLPPEEFRAALAGK